MCAYGIYPLAPRRLGSRFWSLVAMIAVLLSVINFATAGKEKEQAAAQRIEMLRGVTKRDPDGRVLMVNLGSVSNVTDADVAITGVYMGRRRMTLTYPILNRSRRILFLVTGKEKVEMLPKLLAADPSIPAGRIRQDNAVILADRDAAARAAAS